MTVPTSNNREQYQGNDVATEFDFAFKIFKAGDLVVVLTDAEGNESTLVRGTHYSVDGVGETSGGTVTYPLSGEPLATGERLTILREVPVVQETDLRNQGRYYPETLEDEFDRSRMIDQQQQEQLDRTLSRTRASEFFDAKGRRIANVGNATEPQDAYTKGQSDARFADDVITKTGGHWDSKNLRITKLQGPVAPDDAATRGFVDNRFENDVITKPDGQWDAENRRITRVADPSGGQDATNKRTAETYTNNQVAQEAGYRQSADANLQRQISDTQPLEASAFSPISWHPQTIENSVAIPENVNAWSFGPTMTIAAGQSVTVGENSFWTIANGEVTQ